MDLGKDFFLTRFGFMEDYENVIRGGSWFIGEHFLTIKAWEPSFRPSNVTCSLVAVWLRLLELPIEFYDLGVIGSSGKTFPAPGHSPCIEIDGLSVNSCQARQSNVTRKEKACDHGSKAKTRVDNPLTREDHGSVFENDGTDKSKPNNDLGVVRFGRNEGVEPHIPSNTKKQKDGLPASIRSGMVGMGKSLVDIPLRQANDGKKKSFGMESPIDACAGEKLERIGSGGRRRGKENMDIQDGSVIITETRVGGDRANDITDRLPFDEALHADTVGYSSGIWVLWNLAKVEITQLAKNEQEIHVEVKVCAFNYSKILSSIYASSRLKERKLLWNNLTAIALLHHLPWLMLEDFNELLSYNGKLGGNPLNPKHVQMFKECLDSCGMVDLSFHGPRFTWVNKREVGHFIQERLDRGFSNIEWRELYSEAVVHDLAHTRLDHCLVLLKLDSPPSSNHSRSFCFQPV
ncbi:uncharacterized protein LOC142626093 [Castanea sativa]|uniref:uncharacterized protein LOC142626093 n=1 Tax=Castanea sativa TaxID=21020 RepID=UPI003F650371